MPVEPWIPLGVKPPDLPTPQEMISLQNLLQQGQAQRMEMAQRQKDLQRQQAIAQRMQQPDAYDDQGLMTPVAIRDISKIDFAVGQKAAGVRQHQEESIQAVKSRQMQDMVNDEKLKEELGETQNKFLRAAVAEAEVLGPKATKEKRDEAIKKSMQRQWDDREKGGMLGIVTPPMAQKLSSQDYTYEGSKAYLSSTKEGMAAAKEAAAEKRGEETPFMKEQARIKWLESHGQGKSEEAKQLRKHLEKMDTPASLAGTGALSTDALRLAAEQYLSGDRTAAMGYGRSAPMRAALQNEIAKVAKEQGMSGRDIAGVMAQYQGFQAGERTLGTRTANIEMAVTEAQQMAPLALTASKNVKRSDYPTLNKILLAGERGTGDENVVRLGIATNSLINIYARAISPTGVPTVSDKDHARELLDSAWSKGQYAAGIDQLMKELNAARQAPGAVREEMRGAISAPAGKAPQQKAYQGPRVTAPPPLSPDQQKKYEQWKRDHGLQ